STTVGDSGGTMISTV
nr:A3 peptide [Vigna angularis=azuki-beans, cv Dainagon, seeds, Peptide Partial, 15 aa] [Vigna angularis]